MMKLIPWCLVVFCTLMFIAIGSRGDVAAEDDRATPNPSQRELPAGELGQLIELGRELVENTKDHPLTKAYVGNSLNCTSCHLDAGTNPHAATFIGVAAAYPAWSPREGKVITLEDRVLNCFIRSENGTRPPLGSEAGIAMTAYITWLSTGVPIKQNPEKPLGANHVPMLDAGKTKPNLKRGAALYAEHCASCHADDGAGGDDGPPVWGDQSYNDGAGMSGVPKLASWLKVAMPLDDPYLSSDQAFDIAAYVNSHPRPKFDLSKHVPESTASE